MGAAHINITELKSQLGGCQMGIKGWRKGSTFKGSPHDQVSREQVLIRTEQGAVSLLPR